MSYVFHPKWKIRLRTLLLGLKGTRKWTSYTVGGWFYTNGCQHLVSRNQQWLIGWKNKDAQTLTRGNRLWATGLLGTQDASNHKTRAEGDAFLDAAAISGGDVTGALVINSCFLPPCRPTKRMTRAITRRGEYSGHAMFVGAKRVRISYMSRSVANRNRPVRCRCLG